MVGGVSFIPRDIGSGPILPTLTLTGPLTFAVGAAAGTLIANIGNVPPGSTPTVVPNDGRFAIAGDQATGWRVVVGLSASSAGTINITVNAAGATPATVPVIVTAVSFDYVVTNDTEMANVLSLSNATLAGKTIGVAPGTYAPRTISNRPPSKLTIRATDPNNRPKWRRWIARDILNIEFIDIDRTSEHWQLNPEACWSWDATSGVGNSAFRFTNCRTYCEAFRGVPGTPFDPTIEYPEYANVIPQFNESGQVTSVEIRNAYVANYTPDGQLNGTYVNALVFGNIVGPTVNFSAQPQTTMTVVNGNITTVTVENGGSATMAGGVPATGTALNASKGGLSKIVTWPGQRRITDYMPQGEKVIGNQAAWQFNGVCEWVDCSWQFLVAGTRGSATENASLRFENNNFDMIYGDCISFGANAAATKPFATTIIWNNFTRPFSSTRDSNDPHSDPIQLFYFKSTNQFDWPVTIYGNNAWLGLTRSGAGFQGVFVADPPTNGDFAYTGYIFGNNVFSNELGNNIQIEQGRDVFMGDNTVARWDPTNPVNVASAVISLGRQGAKVLGQSFLGGNISEAYATGDIVVGDGSVNTSASTNVQMGLRGATISYADAFANHTGPRVTLAQLLAAYTPKAAYASKGGIGRYIDHINRTVDWSQQRTFVNFPSIIGQAQNAAVNSGWRKIIGGPLTGPISVTEGTYQLADDATGLNATAATSASGTYTRDKFVRVNHTTGNTGSATVTTTLTVNGYSYPFSSITASTTVYPAVQYSGDDRWQRTLGSMGADTGTGTLFIPRFKMTAPAALTTIFGSATGTSAMQIQVLTTGLMRVTFLNAAGTSLGRLDTSIAVADGNEHDIMMSWDTTQTDQSLGRKIYVDGVDRTATAATWTGGAAVGWSANPGTRQYALGGTSAAFGTFSLGMFGLNVSERVDLTVPTNRAKFAADMSGTGGANITGTAWAYWLRGNAAAWNAAGGINEGTGAKFSGGAGANGGAGTLTDA